MAKYSIRDIENLSGIKAHTIRIWEKRYNLVSPSRTDTNIRWYCDEDLKKLLNISILNRNGFKISKIACLDQHAIIEKVDLLVNDSVDNKSQIENLVLSMIEIDEWRFEKTLNANILRIGFENTILKIIHPFLERIGILWQIGQINPAQEHFVSNLIRQKLIVAINNVISVENKDSKRFMLFLPEGELHELGLLFYSYLIKKSGHKYIYLGQSVPFNDLIEVNKLRECDYLVTAFITTYANFNIVDYLNNLSKSFKRKKIFVLGRSFVEQNKLIKNVKLVNSPNLFMNVLLDPGGV